MRKQVQLISLTSLFLISLQLNAQETNKNLVDFVNPFIGTGAFDANSLSGNTFPGATVPFGMVQLSPDTRVNFMPVAGYEYNDTAIFGFSHTHLNGTGVDDLYDILNGGILEFVMGNKPNKRWGVGPFDLPPAWGY